MPARPVWLDTGAFPSGAGTLYCPACRKVLYTYSSTDGPLVPDRPCPHLLFLYRFLGVVNETSEDYVRKSFRRTFDKACAAAWPRYVRKSGRDTACYEEEGQKDGPANLELAERADYFSEQADCLARAASSPNHLVAVYAYEADDWDSDVRLAVGLDFKRPIRRGEQSTDALEACVTEKPW